MVKFIFFCKHLHQRRVDLTPVQCVQLTKTKCLNVMSKVCRTISVLFRTSSCIGVTIYKGTEAGLCHNQLDPVYLFQTYASILFSVFTVAQALSDFKTSKLLLYMILCGKWSLTGCGLHRYSLVFHSFLTSQSNIGLFLNKAFCSHFNFFLIVVSDYYSLAVEVYIKYEIMFLAVEVYIKYELMFLFSSGGLHQV